MTTSEALEKLSQNQVLISESISGLTKIVEGLLDRIKELEAKDENLYKMRQN